MFLNKEIFNLNLEALQAEEYRNNEIEKDETQKLEWFCDAIQDIVEKGGNRPLEPKSRGT